MTFCSEVLVSKHKKIVDPDHRLTTFLLVLRQDMV